MISCCTMAIPPSLLDYAGLYEMCVRMTGKSHTDPEARPFALAVMQHLNDKCAEWRAAENISYSVYGTPTGVYDLSVCKMPAAPLWYH